MKVQGFKDVVKQSWEHDIHMTDSAKRISAKFQRLGKCLKICAKTISHLSILIKNTNEVILLLDALEEFRPLSISEWNGRNFLKEHLLQLLDLQRIYWQQRATIRWVEFGEANSKYFQAKATI